MMNSPWYVQQDDTVVHQTCRSIGFGCALVVALALAPVVQAQVLRIGTLDASRNGSQANLENGTLTEDLRRSLHVPGNLDVLGFDDVEIRAAPELTDAQENLDDVDVVLLHNLFDRDGAIQGDLSGEEQDWLLDFVRQGGGALMVVDYPAAPAAQTFVEPFGLEIAGWWEGVDESSIVARNHPVMNGPFGVVTSVRTYWGGWFTELGPAEPLAALAANGEPSVVAIEPGGLGPGSGAVVLVADANTIGDSDNGQHLYFAQHEVFFLNIIAWLTASEPVPKEPEFRRGDCNADGVVNISDATFLLNWLFAGGNGPGCLAATNTNGDDGANITDATYLLNHLFAGGAAPVAPFPDCGPGTLPADEALGCANPPDCQ